MRTALPTRTFGVEIEILGLRQYEAVAVLRRAGINAVDEEDFGDSDGSGSCDCDECRANRGDDDDSYYDSSGNDSPDLDTQWVVKYDGSVYGHQNGSCEVTTRILSGTEGLAELRKGVEALQAAGATVNETCGLHVHVGARDLTGAEILSLVKRYGRFEDVIDGFMHGNRRGDCNTYCQSVVAYADDADRWAHARGGLDVITPRQIQGWISDRYHKVNVTALNKYGTIEFRHHNGAFQPDTIEAWVTFLLHFVERSRKLVSPAGKRCRDRRVFTGLPKDIEVFYTRRKHHLGDNRAASAWG